MRSTVFKLFGMIAVMLIVSCQEQPVSDDRQKEPATGISEFTGHWSFDIEGGWVGWLGVKQEEGYLDADLLWKWGSVSPVANVFHARDQYSCKVITDRFRSGIWC